jgi:hypothetical protein
VEGATNGSAAPGGTAFTSLTIRFTGIYQFTGAAATITFDPALLTFNPFQSKVSVLGVERSLPAFLTLLSQMENLPGSDFDVYGGENPAGTLFFGAGFTLQGSMPLNGNIIVTTAFDLASTMAVGSVSEVALTQLVMADLDTGIVSLAAPGSPLLMTVTAVPEPESWLMLLAGMGLLGAILPVIPWFTGSGNGATIASIVIGVFAAAALGWAIGQFAERNRAKAAAFRLRSAKGRANHRSICSRAACCAGGGRVAM